ncbi:hypothetical protein AXG93_4509s1010 [Marchantia polymorpha subsp. ruderalis]|uniref:Uncharacterized protein n=1 Tax=Marchantia polymorpha subsp. ruderalis TaxID=1480154 RepID=A0A176WIS5_MARPO|nr:hypothetical protein AXG93_4509s1010 [Marchantia polymorpha subsp. ruderalis]
MLLLYELNIIGKECEACLPWSGWKLLRKPSAKLPHATFLNWCMAVTKSTWAALGLHCVRWGARSTGPVCSPHMAVEYDSSVVSQRARRLPEKSRKVQVERHAAVPEGRLFQTIPDHKEAGYVQMQEHARGGFLRILRLRELLLDGVEADGLDVAAVAMRSESGHDSHGDVRGPDGESQPPQGQRSAEADVEGAEHVFVVDAELRHSKHSAGQVSEGADVGRRVLVRVGRRRGRAVGWAAVART